MADETCNVNGEHWFLDEYSWCGWCSEVTYRDVHGWFGDEPHQVYVLLDAE